jgi:hypothetical protein
VSSELRERERESFVRKKLMFLPNFEVTPYPFFVSIHNTLKFLVSSIYIYIFFVIMCFFFLIWVAGYVLFSLLIKFWVASFKSKSMPTSHVGTIYLEIRL